MLFVERSSAYRAIQALNKKELFGRTLKVCIAADNGRAKDFIKRRVYKDKSRCYECGETGHLSYRCPRNALGDREKPLKKPKRKKGQGDDGGRDDGGRDDGERAEEEKDDEDIDDFSLGDAIRCVYYLDTIHQGLAVSCNTLYRACQTMRESELLAGPSYSASAHHPPTTQQSTERRTIKPDSYFSDEDASD